MIYVIDSYGLIYRSYYAFINKPLINEEGQNVSAIFGFFRNLLSLLKSEKPNCLVAAFDSRTPTFRHEMYPEYKATRAKTPEDLHSQIPIIEEILTSLGIKVIREDGFEADDIIATISAKCEKANRECRILSSDKDLMQLVTNKTQIMRPGKVNPWELVRAAEVEAEWGVPPTKMLDILSLIGDSADNVPGVSGVGIKTALKLLTTYGSLDGIYQNANEIKGAIGEKIRSGKESAYFSQKLIKLCNDVPISSELCDFDCKELDFEKASKLLAKYGVSSVAKDYANVAGIKLDATNFNKSDKTTQTEIRAQSNYVIEDLAKNIPLKQNEGIYSAIVCLEDLQKFIDKAIDIGLCAFDCETDGLNTWECNLVGFSLCIQKGKAFYIPIQKGDDLFSIDGIKKEDAFNQLRRLFCNLQKPITIIMHNGKFDLEVLTAQGLFTQQKSNTNNLPLTAKIVDTMVACWLLESDRSSFSLENLAERKLGLSTIAYKDIVPKNGTFSDVPLEQATKYASEDADLTWQLWQIFKESLNKIGFDHLFYNLEMPILQILAKMEEVGIKINKEELKDYSLELSTQIDKIQEQIFNIVGHEFNIASPKQLQQVLFEERKLPSGKKIKTGYSTDTSVLEELADIDEVPAKILEYRGMSKLLSTYVNALPLLADKNSRIHTSFIQTGTATGRLSSRDPNLQNIPVRDEAGRKIRMAFEAPNNRVLVSADYSQIELVILAHLSQDKNLCNAFKSGIDVHKDTARIIFDVSQEEVSPEMRRIAKTINFGVMYGMSAFRLAKDLKITRTKAQEFINQYFQTYSGVRNFIDKTIKECEETSYVQTIMGRRRYIPNINSKNKTEKAGAERIAINTPIQGSAADIVKQAMIQVSQSLEKKYPNAKLLLQVHDELICECDQKDQESICTLIKEIMENVVQLSIPLKVSVESGRRWGEFH